MISSSSMDGVGEGGSGDEERVEALDRVKDREEELVRAWLRDESDRAERLLARLAAEDAEVVAETREGAQLLTVEERDEDRECCWYSARGRDAPMAKGEDLGLKVVVDMGCGGQALAGDRDCLFNKTRSSPSSS